MIEDTLKNLTAAIAALTKQIERQNDLHAGQPAMKLELKNTEITPPVPMGDGTILLTYPPVAETPKPVETPAPVEAPKPKKLDLADCTAVAQKILDFPQGLDALRELNKRHEIERISKCPPEKVEEVYNNLTSLLAQFSQK